MDRYLCDAISMVQSFPFNPRTAKYFILSSLSRKEDIRVSRFRPVFSLGVPSLSRYVKKKKKRQMEKKRGNAQSIHIEIAWRFARGGTKMGPIERLKQRYRNKYRYVKKKKNENNQNNFRWLLHFGVSFPGHPVNFYRSYSPLELGPRTSREDVLRSKKYPEFAVKNNITSILPIETTNNELIANIVLIVSRKEEDR